MSFNLYTLRHEKRDLNDPTFYSPLIDTGVTKANTTLVHMLETCDIDIIYTSPFLRCIQTVLPFASKHNIPVHIDYRLCEWLRDSKFENEKLPIMEENELYASIRHKEVMYPEDDNSRIARVNEFMESLDNTHNNTMINVLICSHMDIIHDIIKYKVSEWPRGYISMGTLIDLQHVKTNITQSLIIYAHFCNYVIPILHRFIYILSLKEQLKSVINKCSLRSNCMSTSVLESIGSLKMRYQGRISMANQWLKEEYSRMRLVLERQ